MEQLKKAQLLSGLSFPPIDFESGFTVTITNTLGMKFSKSTSNEIRYTASERARLYYDAFYMCIELKSIYIPSSVEEFGMMALYGCRNIRKIYCLGVDPPGGADRMFAGLPSDMMIYVPMESVDKYKKAWYWSDYKSRIVGCNF